MEMATALTVLIASAVWHTIDAMGCINDVCRRLPASRVVVCEIQKRGALKQIFEPCNVFPRFYSDPTALCEVRAGMKVTMRCQDRNATLFRGGEPVSGASYMYTIPFVQPDDEAEFECRSGSSVVARNLSVQGAVVLSTARANCQDFFTCSQEYRCCLQNQAWIASLQTHSTPTFTFNVFGEGPIDIQVETTWLSNHFPVDLKLQVVTSNTTSIQKVIVQQWVQFISEVPEALLTVTANNSFSSMAACFWLKFRNDHSSLQINESLPVDQEVEPGETASFTCKIGFIKGSITDLIAIFEWSPLIGRDEIVNCSLSALHEHSSFCYCPSCRFEVEATDTSQKLFLSYLFRVRIPNVNLNDNGSTVACAVFSYGAVQWKKEATLLVEPARELEGTQDERGKLWYVYASSVAVLVVVGLVSAVVICVLVAWRRRSAAARPLEAAPLTGSMLSMSSSSTEAEMPDQNLTLEYSSAQLPCIEVIAGTPATDHEGRNILSDVHSMDSGLDVVNNGSISSNDEREFSPVHTCTKATVSCYTGPSHHSLHVSSPAAFRTRLSYSTSDLLDIPTDSSIVRKKRRLCVYVSYSDARADWVLNYLKPLIESFQNTEVTVHDADMIAGHPISEERLRLILEADKVIVICSPDYTLSPWCQYELYQAITKQPSLAEGKIIAITSGEWSTLPSVIAGVMALAENDWNFTHRLRAAICRTHRASQ